METQLSPAAVDVYYFANPVKAALPVMATGGHLGMIVTPKQGNRLPAGAWWIADNGAGPGKHGVGAGYPGDEGLLHWLATYTDEQRSRALFAVAPDVVGDAKATLARSRPMLARIRALGFPVALVLQDGQQDVPVPWDEIDAVFIGGTTEFKLGRVAARLAAEAKARGKWVHVGRVNSLKRLRYSVSIGADSVDGTYLVFAPDHNLVILLNWLLVINEPAASKPAKPAFELAA